MNREQIACEGCGGLVFEVYVEKEKLNLNKMKVICQKCQKVIIEVW